ncbi:hypothetical protein [Falsirhodobacter xinxiangensis]|uniref:hypothetical protein n=1 Tax=Falsirhodobacter xinxiangensis TaxID=2530049 RepID=UPI0010AA767B|nr:hypothetical protein [Rhodobacter xinxiangensis]
MIRLEFLNLIVRTDRLRDRYPGGWEQLTRDFYWELEGGNNHDGPLTRFGAMNDQDMLEIQRKLEAMGLRLTRKLGGQLIHADMAYPGRPDDPGLPCPWLNVREDADDGFTAHFVGVPDPRWAQHRIRVTWGKHRPFMWFREDDLMLYACELKGAASADVILARALTRLALEDMIRDDYAMLQMTHEDGRKALLHAYGKHRGFDVPYVMAPPDFNIGSHERGVGTPYRNFTEIITDGWLADNCIGTPTNRFEGITLIEVI